MGQVLLVQGFHPLQVFLQQRDEAVGQHGHPVLFPFAVTDDEGSPFEVKVLDAQAQTFHQPYAAAIDQLGHQLVCARQAADEAQSLLPGQDGGQPFGAFGAQRINGAQVLAEHFTVEEKQGAEGLILCGSGDVLLDCKVSEKGFDLWRSHLGWVAHAVEKDVTLDPADVGLLGAVGIVSEAQGVADLIQEFFGALLLHGLAGCLLLFDKKNSVTYYRYCRNCCPNLELSSQSTRC